MSLTLEQLKAILPKRPANVVSGYLEPLNGALRERGIDRSQRRTAYFLAQIMHESGGLVYWRELWGPTAQQRRYDPPSALSHQLGNTEEGDGFRYRGRGPIQITGRANYAHYGKLLGVDLVARPELLETPLYGLRSAAAFWDEHHCNSLADAEDFTGVTRAINGGLNGLESRKAWLRTVTRALASSGGTAAHGAK